MKAEGNKAKGLVAGNLKNLSSSIEVLEAHMSPYSSAMVEREEWKTKQEMFCVLCGNIWDTSC